MSKADRQARQVPSHSILPCCDHYIFKRTFLDDVCKKELDRFLVYLIKREPIKGNEMYEKRVEEIRRKLVANKYNNLYHVIDSVLEFRKCDRGYSDQIYHLLEKFFPKDAYTKLINLDGVNEETDA